MRRKDVIENEYFCKKTDCKYNRPLGYAVPSLAKIRACHYCIDTGFSRNCDVEDCLFYAPVSPVEKKKYIKSIASMRLADGLRADKLKAEENKVTWRSYDEFKEDSRKYEA